VSVKAIGGKGKVVVKEMMGLCGKENEGIVSVNGFSLTEIIIVDDAPNNWQSVFNRIATVVSKSNQKIENNKTNSL
jgi:hypothetical protein